MVGGGIAAALLACQMASRAYSESEYEQPSYTVPEAMYPRSSETASINCCMTSQPSNFSTGSFR